VLHCTVRGVVGFARSRRPFFFELKLRACGWEWMKARGLKAAGYTISHQKRDDPLKGKKTTD
jgi:hypothetical protein